MTATVSPHSPAPPAVRATGPLRLALAPPGSAPALLDGAWWPYSRDLAFELPLLVAELDQVWGLITRVTVNPTHWPEIPRKVPVAGHVVKVGWFLAEQDPHKLLLLSRTVGRWDLLVVPPQAPDRTAAWLMEAACDPARRVTASTLVAEAPDFGFGDEEARREAWEAEGGRALPG